MGYGLLLRVTHTGKAGDSIHVSDIRDGMDVLGGASPRVLDRSRSSPSTW